jgi:dipeptidase
MDLVRLGLERGGNAREALEIIAELLERHGQGGSSFAASGDDGYQNSFVIADGRSVWILETTARGWAASAENAVGGTNALTLGRDWQIGSSGLEKQALSQGFCEREERLDFRGAYAPKLWPEFLTTRRREATERSLSGPPLTLTAMKEWLCDHGAEDLPPAFSRATEDPDRYSVCMHADPMSMTTASLVTRLPEEVGRRPWPVWISFATPCTGLFVPVYLDGVIPARLAATGAESGGSKGEIDSAWEAMRRLQERATEDFERSIPILRAGWKDLARSVERERLRVEQEVSVYYDAKRIEAGEDELSRFMATTADRLIEQTVVLTNQL